MRSRLQPRPSGLRCALLPLALAIALATAPVLTAPTLAGPAERAGSGEGVRPSLDAVFGESIDVRVVNVEAVVTDRRGNRVHGLGPGDLRLLVDGEAVPIEFFTEVRTGVAARKGSGTESSAPPPEPAVAGERVPTSYLVFVDDVFTLGRDRNRVLRSLAESIDRMRPGDRMAVVVHSQTGLEMVTSWTDSGRELERALRAVEMRPAKGLLRFAAYKSLPSELPAGISRTSLRFADAEEPSHSLPEHDQHDEAWLNRTVSAAAASLRAFADAPGRKVMLLYAGGWKLQNVFSFGDRSIGDPYNYVDPYRFLRTYGPLAETANLLGYTVYPVDVPGEVSSFGADVELGSSAGGSPFGFDRYLEDSLHYIAGTTGGRALVDGERMHALENVASDTADFYWLGFTPPHAGADRSHRIEVDAVRPGLRVRTRQSYRELTPWIENSMMVESALLFGDLPSDGGIEISTGPPEAAEDRTMILPLRIRVPLDQVTALPADGGFNVRLETLVAAEDDRGRRSGVVSRPIVLQRAAPPEAGDHAVYETRLALDRRPHELVVAVHDPIARRNLFARVAVVP
jgi:VWFA-related protein